MIFFLIKNVSDIYFGYLKPLTITPNYWKKAQPRREANKTDFGMLYASFEGAVSHCKCHVVLLVK